MSIQPMAAPQAGVTDAEFDDLVHDSIAALERQPPELRDRILRTLRDPVDCEAFMGRLARYARERDSAT
jgi:hypothetical protein